MLEIIENPQVPTPIRIGALLEQTEEHLETMEQRAMRLRCEWKAALRSDEYDQATGQLYDARLGYCCLGVADEAVFEAVWTYDAEQGWWEDQQGAHGTLSDAHNLQLGIGSVLGVHQRHIVREVLGIEAASTVAEALVWMNDRHKASFHDIADALDLLFPEDRC